MAHVLSGVIMLLVPVRPVDEDRGSINDGENVGVVGEDFATNDLVDVMWKKVSSTAVTGRRKV
jgi:hypothetical protein